MSVSEDNKHLVRRVFEDAINAGKLELLNDLVADDYVGTNSGLGIVGAAAFATPLTEGGFPGPSLQPR